MLKRRLKLDRIQKRRFDKVIIEKTKLAVEDIKPKVIHIFRSLEQKAEVNTSELFRWAQDNGIAVYSTVETKGVWQVARFETSERFWIERPASVDVILVPLLAFDDLLHRIGYGGGYYDRLAAEFPKARRIGLAYEMQKIENIPIESHDMKLDLVITEEGRYPSKDLT